MKISQVDQKPVFLCSDVLNSLLHHCFFFCTDSCFEKTSGCFKWLLFQWLCSTFFLRFFWRAVKTFLRHLHSQHPAIMDFVLSWCVSVSLCWFFRTQCRWQTWGWFCVLFTWVCTSFVAHANFIDPGCQSKTINWNFGTRFRIDWCKQQHFRNNTLVSWQLTSRRTHQWNCLGKTCDFPSPNQLCWS